MLIGVEFVYILKELGVADFVRCNQPTVFSSHTKPAPATSQSVVIFSHNKPAPATSRSQQNRVLFLRRA